MIHHNPNVLQLHQQIASSLLHFNLKFHGEAVDCPSPPFLSVKNLDNLIEDDNFVGFSFITLNIAAKLSALILCDAAFDAAIGTVLMNMLYLLILIIP